MPSQIMFTPQKKVWSGWSLTPRTEKNGTGSGSDGPNLNSIDGTVGKGKSVAIVEPVTPLNGDGPGQETESLAQKISRLENEVKKSFISVFFFSLYIFLFIFWVQKMSD